jgi:hypothetical protein
MLTENTPLDRKTRLDKAPAGRAVEARYGATIWMGERDKQSGELDARVAAEVTMHGSMAERKLFSNLFDAPRQSG